MSGSMGVAIADKIAKQRLNVIMLVDCSSSMRGERIAQVNEAIRDIKKYLTEMQSENTNVDFYITVITYSTDAFFLNRDKCKPIEELSALKKLPWFKVALKYGIAIELNDKRTIGCLTDFVSGNGDVIECYDSRLLERIIKIIVLTASKVKSTSTSVHAEKNVSVTEEVKQQVQQAIAEVDDWEW